MNQLWFFILSLVGIFTYQNCLSLKTAEPKLVMVPPTQDNVIVLTSKTIKQWTKSLDKYLAVYETPGLTPGRGQNIVQCDYDNPPKKGEVCDVDVKNWTPCDKENLYGYNESSVCIFLKLNEIDDWTPLYYNDVKNLDLPADMPEDLKTHIANVTITSPQMLNTVWVSCEGLNSTDIENIGPIKYIPSRGFPGYFFPYENTDGYLSPLVAIHLETPNTGNIINIICKAWAKDIKNDSPNEFGSVHIILHIIN